MSENSQYSKGHFRTPQADNMTFKSSIFERRDINGLGVKNLQQSKNQLLNVQSDSHFSSFLAQSNIKQQNDKTASRPMFNSTISGLNGKSFTGSLFQMARLVEEKNDDTNLQLQKEKNKYTFLHVPKLNIIKPSQFSKGKDHPMTQSIISKQLNLKPPSFLKKQTKSSIDPNQEHQNQIFNKPDFNKSSSKKSSFDTKSQIQAKKTSQSQTNTPQNFSPLLAKTKINSNSPKTQNSKNLSTNQPKQSSSNNTYLDPKSIPSIKNRKGSFIFQNDKQFYTPTEKNSVKLGSSNFIQIAEKYNSTYNGSANNDNKSRFLQIHQQQKCHNLSPMPKDGQKKTFTPSFIKLKQKQKQKRNQIEKAINIKTLLSPDNYMSHQSEQRRFSIDDFEIKERLGKGAFGDVYLARQKLTGMFIVLKKLSKKRIKQQNTQQLIMRQIKIQSFLSHRHITNLYGFFDDEQYIYLIMEYMSDGSLAQRFNRKKVPQKQVAVIVKQICDALNYIHIQNIIHRDIKPDNVFIHQDYIKLGDFGCSVFSDSKRNTMVGSLAYFSPQQLNNELYDQKIDVWSVGILCYQLLTGRSPFEQDIMKITRQQKDAKLSQLRFPSKIQLSEQAKDFTRRLLEQLPQNRLSIKQALKHAFIMKNSLTQNIINLSEIGLKQL